MPAVLARVMKHRAPGRAGIVHHLGFPFILVSVLLNSPQFSTCLRCTSHGHSALLMGCFGVCMRSFQTKLLLQIVLLFKYVFASGKVPSRECGNASGGRVSVTETRGHAFRCPSTHIKSCAWWHTVVTSVQLKLGQRQGNHSASHPGNPT